MVSRYLDEGNAFVTLRGAATCGDLFGVNCIGRRAERLEQVAHRLVPIADREARTGGKRTRRL